MTPPLVSVLMTAWNREAYVGEAIRSVLAQTFTDFELLIVDDASTDDTVAVAKAWAEGDARVRVVVNDRNLGQFPNRNHAASLARGQFLKYHDSDDVMYPHCLKTMVGALMNAPQAGFALTSHGAWAGGPCPMQLTPRQCYEREFLGFGMFFGGPACGLFRSAAFRTLGGFPEQGVSSDYLFWLQACARTSVLLVPGDLFWYRRHDGQEMVHPGVGLEYVHLARARWLAIDADECPLDAAQRRQARRNLAALFVREMYRNAKAGHPGLAWAQLRHCGLSAGDWLRYLRRPRRSPRAGTPLMPAGESRMPGTGDWMMRPPA